VGGDQGAQLVDQYYFEDVVVTELNSSGANADQVSLDYARFSHGHIEYDNTNGTKISTTEAGWDFVLNEAFSGKTVAPDVDLF
jgi:hypothetical protein